MRRRNGNRRVVIFNRRGKKPELRMVYGRGFNLTIGESSIFKTMFGKKSDFLTFCENNDYVYVGEIPWWYPFKWVGLLLFLNTPHQKNYLSKLFGVEV